MSKSTAVSTQVLSATKPSMMDNKFNRLLVGVTLVVVLMLILSGISYITLKKITEDQLSPERLEAMERMSEISKNNLRKADYVPPTQFKNQNKTECYTKPDVGWNKFYAENKALINTHNCLDLQPPRGTVVIRLENPPEKVGGNFVVTPDNNSGHCISSESHDNCLSFLRQHTKEYLIFKGERIFIQPRSERRM